MKKIELEKLELISGGGFWSSLGDGIAGGCLVYTGAVLFKIISNAHPVLKGLSYGCYAYLGYRAINALE